MFDIASEDLDDIEEDVSINTDQIKVVHTSKLSISYDV